MLPHASRPNSETCMRQEPAEKVRRQGWKTDPDQTRSTPRGPRLRTAPLTGSPLGERSPEYQCEQTREPNRPRFSYFPTPSLWNCYRTPAFTVNSQELQEKRLLPYLGYTRKVEAREQEQRLAAATAPQPLRTSRPAASVRTKRSRSSAGCLWRR